MDNSARPESIGTRPATTSRAAVTTASRSPWVSAAFSPSIGSTMTPETPFAISRSMLVWVAARSTAPEGLHLGGDGREDAAPGHARRRSMTLPATGPREAAQRRREACVPSAEVRDDVPPLQERQLGQRRNYPAPLGVAGGVGDDRLGRWDELAAATGWRRPGAAPAGAPGGRRWWARPERAHQSRHDVREAADRPAGADGDEVGQVRLVAGEDRKMREAAHELGGEVGIAAESFTPAMMPGCRSSRRRTTCGVIGTPEMPGSGRDRGEGPGARCGRSPCRSSGRWRPR